VSTPPSGFLDAIAKLPDVNGMTFRRLAVVEPLPDALGRRMSS
jgi:hypothetical protein